jgi:hypothetical protein
MHEEASNNDTTFVNRRKAELLCLYAAYDALDQAETMVKSKVLVAASDWIEVGPQLVREILVMHSKDRSALVCRKQTIHAGFAPPDSIKITNDSILIIRLNGMHWPDLGADLLCEQRGPGWDVFVARCFACIMRKEGPITQQLHDVLSEDNDDRMAEYHFHKEFVYTDMAADVYGRFFPISNVFTVSMDGCDLERTENDLDVSTCFFGDLEKLVDPFANRDNLSFEEINFLEDFHRWLDSLPQSSPIRRMKLLRQAEILKPLEENKSVEATPPKFNNFGDQWLTEVARSPDGESILCKRQVWTGRYCLNLATDETLFPDSFVSGMTGCYDVSYDSESKCWTGCSSMGHGKPHRRWKIDATKREATEEEFDASN